MQGTPKHDNQCEPTNRAIMRSRHKKVVQMYANVKMRSRHRHYYDNHMTTRVREPRPHIDRDCATKGPAAQS